MTTSEVSPKERSPIPPALPTSTTGANTMLIPSARRSAPRSAASDVERLGRLPGEGGRAGQLAEHPLHRLHRAALVVDGHEQRQVVAERRRPGSGRPRSPSHRARTAPPGRVGLSSSASASAGASPSTPIMSVIASRDRSGRSAVADAHVAGVTSGDRFVRPGVTPTVGSRTRARGGSGPAGSTTVIRRRRYTARPRRRGARAPTATRRGCR